MYGTMQRTMIPAPADISFGNKMRGMLDHMDGFMDRAQMVSLAQSACAYIGSYLNGPASQADKLVASLDGNPGRGASMSSDTNTLVVEVVHAAVLLARSEGRQTHREELEGAVTVLARRYNLS